MPSTAPVPDSAEQRFRTINQEISTILKDAEALLLSEQQDAPRLDKLARHLAEVRRKWESQTFQVAVLALVKSGKSTFINALLGAEFLPAANVPCTTRIVRVRHRPEQREGVLADGDERVDGIERIFCHLRRLNDAGREPPGSAGTAAKQPLAALPRPWTDGELTLEAPLAGLQHHAMAGQEFELLDTPGPNEAGAGPLRARLFDLLERADVIVYLLDYTKLKTDEEMSLFKELKDLRQDILQRWQDRLFFLVNKMDLKDRSGLSEAETTAYVAVLLRNQVDLEIPPDRILPVSAERGVLARMVLTRRASRKVLEDFVRRTFGEETTADAVNLDSCQPSAERMLQRSGIPEFEKRVLSHLYAHRGKMLLGGLVSDLDRHLNAFHNHLVTAQATLEADQKQLEERIQALRAEVQKVRDRLEHLTGRTRQFQDDLNAWVRQELQRFTDEVDQEVEGSLADTPRPGFFQSTVGKIKNIIGLAQAARTPQANREAAKAKAEELNRYLAEYLSEAFADFRARLEEAAHGRQGELFGDLTRAIAPLREQIDQQVGKALEVTLRPVPVHLPQPSVEELRRNVSRSLDQFLEAQQRQEPYLATEPVLLQPAGWCRAERWGSHRVFRYRDVTEYQFDLEQLREAWRQRIRELTRVSLLTVDKLIDSQVMQAVNEARADVEEYADGYLRDIEKEMVVAREGKEQHQQRLDEVRGRCQQVVENLDRVAKCQEYLDGPRP